MEAFKERMIAEYVELDERVNKLDEFILKNPKFIDLNAFQQEMMRKQFEGMVQYKAALKERMKLEGITHDDVVNYKHPYQNLSFGEALQALEAGKCVRRESWIGDCFLVMRTGTMVVGENVPKLQSIPESCKPFLSKTNDGALHFMPSLLKIEQFSEWSEAKDYSPNGEDLFSKDWMVL